MNLMKVPGEIYNCLQQKNWMIRDLKTLLLMTDYELADIGFTRGTLREAFYKGRK